MNDEKIVELYLARNESAVDETQKKYSGYLKTIAYNILASKEDAEECENDTYFSAWYSIPPAVPKSLSAFLGAITRNISLKRLRSRMAEKRGGGEADVSLHELSECLPDPCIDQERDAEALTEALNKFFDSISRDERNLFICRYWYCFSVSDIAARFEINENTAKSKLKRTREKLQRYLRKENIHI